MTDTTDIAALSYARLIEVRNILSGFEDGYDTVEDKENYEAMRDAQALINELISARWRLVTVTTNLEAERQRADDLQHVIDRRDNEIADLKDKLSTPVALPKAAYFSNSAENLPFFRAFSVIEAIHKVGFLTVTYED
ncbi:hypothetical protein ACE2AK_04095 [Rahnella perminowiae]|uniref:hypothetical protein n=1 Tax=Rahnella perminowiae TaxID=2816244 RepID=UPI003659B531